MASQLLGRERRDFWMLSVGQLLIFCGFYAFFQFPLYIKALGGAEQAIGIIMGVTALAATLLMPWIIALVDRIERKALMLAGVCLVELATMACVVTTSPGVLMGALMMARGLGFAVYMIASGAYLAQIMPPEEKSRWIGVNLGFNQVAIGLGPLIGELVIHQVNFPYFFFVSAALVYSGMLLLLPISARAPVPPPVPFRAMDSLVGFFAELAGPRFRNTFLTLLLMAGALGAVFNFTATYTQLLGLSSGLFFATYALTNAATRFGAGGLADRYGRTLVVVPTLVMFGAGIYVFSVTQGTLVMLVAAVLIGVGFALPNPAIFALMLDRAPPRLQGMAVGGFHFAYQLGLLCSPPLFGVIAERWGYAPMWWIAGAMALGAIGPYLLPELRAGAAGERSARISDAE
ncbi:MAG: MFS transporter [SAR324 cluster bacterium]|nr:MFS transporter [SAR324 cluster bacterium]